MSETEARLASMEDKLSTMQAQISNLLRLQRYLVEGHLKLNDDRVAIAREHIALFECLSSEGVVKRTVLNSYVQAQKVSDQLNTCMHDPHISQLIVRAAGLTEAGRFAACSSTCWQHVLGCVLPGEKLEAKRFAAPWTRSLLSLCYDPKPGGLDAPLSEPGIAHAFISVAGARVTARLATASHFCHGSLRIGSPMGACRGMAPLVPAHPVVSSLYSALRERSSARAIAACIGGMSVCELSAASWACKGSMCTRFHEGGGVGTPQRCLMAATMPVKKGGCNQPLAKRLHSVLHLPRVTLAVMRCLGHNRTGNLQATSRWLLACAHSTASGLRLRAAGLPLQRSRIAPPDPIYCSAGGQSGPSFANAIEFSGARLPQAPLTLAARIRTTSKNCQVIAGWGSADGCSSAELRLKNGNLEYMERFGMWWGWKSVEACNDIDLASGTWHGVAVVRLKSGEVSLYADGMYIGGGLLEPAIPTGLVPTAKSAHLHRSWNGYAFNGEIGPLFIYDCAVSLEQLCASGIFPAVEARVPPSIETGSIRSALQSMEAELALLMNPTAQARLANAPHGQTPALRSGLNHLSTLIDQDPSDSWSIAARAIAMMEVMQASEGFSSTDVDRRAMRARGCFPSP